ncbi:MAG: GGDEF domain-containing protein [Oscillospiraceae bacterium]
MIFSVSITPTQIIDFRMLPVIMMALYSSPLSSITAVSIIIIFRVAYFGLNIFSVSAVALAIVVGVGCILISRLHIKMNYKWFFSILLLVISATVVTILTLDLAVFGVVITTYFIGVAGIGFGLYHLLNILLAANISYEKIQEEAKTDFLTGISNLRDMQKSLHSLFKRAKEKNESLSVMYVDVDNFKKINDTYGHLEGDKVLKNVAHTLLSACKNTDIVSRRGGDEFTVLLVDCNMENTKKVAARILKNIEQYIYTTEAGLEHTITVSIGISSFPETAMNETMLIEKADEALYKAKALGKNSFQLSM